jgi:hypothetical protein
MSIISYALFHPSLTTSCDSCDSCSSVRWHVRERVAQLLLAEGKLRHGPDLGVGLELLLDLHVEGAGLDGDDLGRRVLVAPR